MKNSYPKTIVNAVVVVLVFIIISITFTMNSPIRDKKDCYKKVYKEHVNKERWFTEWSSKENKYIEGERTQIEMEGKAAQVAAISCYGTYKK